VPGACTLIATNGLPTPGSFTISSVTRFGQASEAISVSGGTSIISGNYAINATSPAPTTKFLEWNFEDCHINTALGAIKVNGIAALSFGNGMWCTSPSAGITFIDVNNGDSVNIDNFQFTSNDLSNVTVFKGRNISAGRFCNNNLYLIKYAVDLDNTVLDFKVHGNTAYSLTTGNNPAPPTFLYSGNRYNQTSFRGVDFKSNGKLGQGFDTDDNRMLGWFPGVTSQLGSTVNISFFSGQGGVGVDNGVFHLGCSFQITGIGY
jgi:hypothetical protein